MQFHPFSKKISVVLGGENTYTIPNFQRDYSWEKKNYEDFISDLLTAVDAKFDSHKNKFIFSNGQITDYFFGTILLVGDEDNPKLPYTVIDGQQRLTTMTLFLVSISNIIKSIDRDYVHAFDEALIKVEKLGGDRKEFARLQNRKLHPILPVNILNINNQRENGALGEVTKKSQELLLDSFKIIKDMLDKKNLVQRLAGIKDEKKIEEIPDRNYIGFLELIGNQILNSTVISIYSTSRDQANILYRNFNSRGKPLSQSDLIKNELFSNLSYLGDKTDYALTQWEQAEQNVFMADELIDTFLFHFMTSKYSVSTKNSLFKVFDGISKTEKEYNKFLNELRLNSFYYRSIIKPEDNLTLFDSEKYFTKDDNSKIRRQLNFLDNIGATQVRIILLGLFFARGEGALSNKQFSKFIKIVTEHQAVHVLSRTPGNQLTPIYRRYAKIFYSNSGKIEFGKVLNDLVEELNAILPTSDILISRADITYDHTKSNAREMKNKYLIKHILETIAYNMQSNTLNSGNDGLKFIEDATIEHIFDQAKENIEDRFSLGNLILLERSKQTNSTNKRNMYERSEITMTNNFFTEYKNFDPKDGIKRRRNELLEKYRDIVKNVASN